MLTIKKIKEENQFVENDNSTPESYLNCIEFKGHGTFCDVYFICQDGELSQSQVDNFNEFQSKYLNYLPEIKTAFTPFLSHKDQQNFNSHNFPKVSFDVIEVPFKNLEFDIVLNCSVKVLKFFIFKKNVSLEIKIKNERIISIQ